MLNCGFGPMHGGWWWWVVGGEVRLGNVTPKSGRGGCARAVRKLPKGITGMCYEGHIGPGGSGKAGVTHEMFTGLVMETPVGI